MIARLPRTAARFALAGVFGASSLLALAMQAAHADNLANAVPGEIIVALKPAASRSIHSQKALTTFGQPVSSHPATGAQKIHLNPGVDLQIALNTLRQRSDVRYAEPNFRVRAFVTPNDTKYRTNQWAPKQVGMEDAWAIWRPQGQVILSIVDTGVSGTHPDLTNKITKDSNGSIFGYNAILRAQGSADDDQGHGTHCAGIAAAQSNNGVGVAGIAGWTGLSGTTDADHVKILPVKCLDASGSGTDDDVAAGIEWAADNGAKVISLSLGGPDTSQVLSDSVTYAISKGCVVCGAAGNEGVSTFDYPGAYPDVISVAATDTSDTLAYFSNYGSWVKVAAPGVGIQSTLPNASYGNESGTSMATPLVAGEAALLFAQNPTLTREQVVALIVNNVDAYTPFSDGNDLALGAGRVNVFKALTAAGSPVNLLWQNPDTLNVVAWQMGGLTPFAANAITNTTGKEWRVEATADLDGDGYKDLIWRNTLTGDLAVWHQNWWQVTSAAYITQTNTANLRVAAAADFDADGKPDLILQDTATGRVTFAKMDGAHIVSQTILVDVSTDWQVVAAADINNDGKPDLIWQQQSTGAVVVWTMNNTAPVASLTIVGGVPLEWHVVVVADMNNDGKPDLLWRNINTGENAVWLLDGITPVSGSALASVPNGWNLVGAL